MTDYRRTLFLHPPAVAGFDGGAGSRYQARREIRSFWYPTWLAQPAALVPGSRLVDAPPDGLTLDDVRPLARGYDLCVMHTSTPSLASDVRVIDKSGQLVEVGTLAREYGFTDVDGTQPQPFRIPAST